ncbi:pyruvate kinase [Porphyromonas loveana]|uniref:Pyruvate kinase n=3 Tax=Porphyromonas loveana TaxID=1884669 RepID=A0A2U1FH91_9PORP|nr:pyruvate kinase [Porphyromonas loveana]PVZ11564.1 pyruvate kinase [Porphyromonas loveana]
MKQTKIVATISGLRCDVDFLRSLYEAGVNVLRLNSAHMDEEGFDRVIDNARAVSPHLAVLMDTKGPEVRTTICDEPVSFSAGDHVLIKPDPDQKTTNKCIGVSYPLFVQDVAVGSRILVDDGDLELEVVSKGQDSLGCVVFNDSVLGSRKSVNVPGVRINLPSLTEKDKKNIQYSIRKGVDFIAHSFVRTKQDVLDIQQILDAEGSDIKIIAKIENQEGVDNIDEILDVAYGVMIARGDLGIEVPQEKIPAIQRMLIRKCVERKSPVIVATQMLHSMIKNPRPTRAEVTDVANAIYYRTDAVMLSGETAYGKYPLEAVQTMSRIIEEAEKSKIAANDIRISYDADDLTTTAFLAKQAVKSVGKLGVKAIITDSYTGATARSLAAFRGRVPVYAICYEESVIRKLALSYGVITSYEQVPEGHTDGLKAALLHLIDAQFLTPEDKVAYMRGLRGKDGSTTALEIDLVKYLISRE